MHKQAHTLPSAAQIKYQMQNSTMQPFNLFIPLLLLGTLVSTHFFLFFILIFISLYYVAMRLLLINSPIQMAP